MNQNRVQITLAMSGDGRVRCVVHARRDPAARWEALASVVAADGGHACEVCGAYVDDELEYSDFYEPDLWVSGWDGSSVCRAHAPADLQKLIAISEPRVSELVVRVDGRDRSWFAVPVLSQAGSEQVLACGECSPSADLSNWKRVAFPADWADGVRPQFVATLLQLWRIDASQAGQWNTWLADTVDSLGVEEDGRLRFRCDHGVYSADLVESSGLGVWLRLIHEPWVPGPAHSTVQYRTVRGCAPAPGGLDDPQTIFRALLHLLAPIDVLGGGVSEYTGPAGDVLLCPDSGEWEVFTADGMRLAGGLSATAAIALLEQQIGERGTVFATLPTMQAFTTVPLPSEPGDRPGDRYVQSHLTAYAHQCTAGAA